MTTSNQTQGDPSASNTLLVGVIGAIVVFAIIVGLHVLFYNEEDAVSRLYSQDPQELRLLVAQQQENLHGYRMIDPQKGITAIPIEDAMTLVVRELAREGQKP